MFRLSRMADYGVVVLSSLAQRGDAGLTTATELSERTTLPAPTVSKILKALARGGVIDATRGAHGGYALSRPADGVTVAEIIAALDGPVALTACVEGSDDTCAAERLCPMAGGWNRINTAVKTALDSVTLADLMAESAMLPPEPATERVM